jgi:predicted component of type VI protein secretion system
MKPTNETTKISSVVIQIIKGDIEWIMNTKKHQRARGVFREYPLFLLHQTAA